MDGVIGLILVEKVGVGGATPVPFPSQWQLLKKFCVTAYLVLDSRHSLPTQNSVF